MRLQPRTFLPFHRAGTSYTLLNLRLAPMAQILSRGVASQRTLIPVLSSTFRSSGLAPDFLSQYCHGYSTQDTVPSSVIKQFYLTAQTLGIQEGAYRSNLGTGVGISHYSLLTKHSHSERQKETMTSFRRFLSSPQFREAPAEIQIQNCAHSYWQKLENERHGIPLRYMVKCQNVRTVSLLVP